MLSYDEDILYNNSELSGFYFCCQESEYDCYDSHTYKWPPVAADHTRQIAGNMLEIDLAGMECQDDMAPSLAYLWRETPIETPIWGAPVYSAGSFSLPSAPWIILASELPL